MIRICAGAACLLLLSSCYEFGEKDAKIPGDELGSFHVVGRMDVSSCGPGALGSKDVWEFDVKLSRDGDDLYWLNGKEPVYGRIAADGVTFSFDSQSAITTRAAKGAMPGCTVIRRDLASGVLQGGADVSGFSGDLRFGYAPTPESDCTDLVGVDGGFAQLPCEIGYEMTAAKSAE
jgi:hypothetical protein